MNILNYKKPGFWVVIVAVIAVAAISVGLMSNPQKEQLTARSIKTGDSLEKLHSIYPELEPVLDNRKDPENMAYMIKEDFYDHIVFEVNNGSVAMITIYHEFA